MNAKAVTGGLATRAQGRRVSPYLLPRSGPREDLAANPRGAELEHVELLGLLLDREIAGASGPPARAEVSFAAQPGYSGNRFVESYAPMGWSSSWA